MAELPFFPLATDAFLADCGHLDDAETGRYFLLLIALWRAPQQRLPNDDDWLARKFRRDVERVRSELRPIIAEFCQSDGNWITQRRVSKEYKRALTVSAQRRDAVKSRWTKEKGGYERNTGSYGFRNTLIPTPTPIQSSLSENHTDAAREPAPDSEAPARAPAVLVPERRGPGTESPDARATRLRLADITAAKRAAFLKGQR